MSFSATREQASCSGSRDFTGTKLMHDHPVSGKMLFKLSPIAVGRVQNHRIAHARTGRRDELSVVGVKSGQRFVIGKLLKASAVVRNFRDLDEFALGWVICVVEQVTQERIANARLPRGAKMSPVLFKNQPEPIEHHNPVLHQFPQSPNTLELAPGSGVRLPSIRNDRHVGVDDRRVHSAADSRRCNHAS
jgi:hypothetical protein